MIKKEGKQYFVYSQDGSKRLSKGYSNRTAAARRKKQIEWFKHLDKVHGFNAK